MKQVPNTVFVPVFACLICFGATCVLAGSPDQIDVDYEYGTLKEVVVGVPYIIFPDLKVAKWAQEALKILPADEVKKSLYMSGKDSITIGIFQELEKENKELIAILEKHGVKVLRPEILNRQRVVENFGEDYVRFAGVSQQYTRDPVIVIGNNVIENTMGSLYRRSDILGLVNLFKERVMGSNARWVAMPAIDYSLMIKDGQFDKTGFPALEGGDVIELGKKILVGTSKNPTTGSSELGYRWLKVYLEPQGYDVERVRLPEDILHLDLALSVPRPGVIIVCPEVFIDGIPSCFNGWKRIELSRVETRYLAINGLPVDKDHYIMGYNEHFDGKRIKKALEECGIKVYPIYFEGHTRFGGSIRCSTLPFVRQLSDGSNVKAK